MPKNKKKAPKKKYDLDDSGKRYLKSGLDDFLQSEETEFSFPCDLTNDERHYVHDLARQLNLTSKSKGKEPNRYVTVYKKEEIKIPVLPTVTLKPKSLRAVEALLKTHPVSDAERSSQAAIVPPSPYPGANAKSSASRLYGSHATVPRPLHRFTNQSLPIWPMREEIVKSIQENSVVIITGDTGCGKTTQVPQFILDYHGRKQLPCKIVCSMPRRLAAVTVSERVASERQEPVGQSVGYHIRFDSKMNPGTNLVYCTNGVLLRTLNYCDMLNSVTHIIVDEIHERDHLSDFMLIVLRDALAENPNLRLILMSATMDAELFQTYFEGVTASPVPVIYVPGRMYEVKECYLEDILTGLNYCSQKMIKTKSSTPLLRVLEDKPQGPVGLKAILKAAGYKPEVSQAAYDAVQIETHLLDAYHRGSNEALRLAVECIKNGAPIDYQVTTNGVTALMVAVIQGDLDLTVELLMNHANVNLMNYRHKTAVHLARESKDPAMIEVIEEALEKQKPKQWDRCLTLAEQEDLDLYEKCHSQEVDTDLIAELIHAIHKDGEEGAILVFFPGYEDIMAMKEKLLNDQRLAAFGRVNIYILHSRVQGNDQKNVFKPARRDERKIILSTNIAETSITIEDVTYVIDSGKIKQKSYNVMSSVGLLQRESISQACASQRAGRAGRARPGVCFHLFSRNTFNDMMSYQVPEILRTPLQELCLYAKQLAPPGTSVEQFLAKAVEPPFTITVTHAIGLLKEMGALDPDENLTVLGRQLLNLPLEPRYGKMILTALALQCLDPVMKIVGLLSSGEVFRLPSNPQFKTAGMQIKRQLGLDCLSDHMVYLQISQGWERCPSWQWCQEHYINQSSVETLPDVTRQLLDHLQRSGLVSNYQESWGDLNRYSHQWVMVKAALAAGAYPNIAQGSRATKRPAFKTHLQDKVMLHSSSLLKEQYSQLAKDCATCDFVIYDEQVRVGPFSHMITCSLVSPVTVLLFTGPVRLPDNALQQEQGAESSVQGPRQAILNLDDFLVFKMDTTEASCIMELRIKFNSLLESRLQTGAPCTALRAMNDTLVKVLALEEPLDIKMLKMDYVMPGPPVHKYGGGRGQRRGGPPRGGRGRQPYRGNHGQRTDRTWTESDGAVGHTPPQGKPSRGGRGGQPRANARGGVPAPRTWPGEQQPQPQPSSGDVYFLITMGLTWWVKESMERGEWPFHPATAAKLREAFNRLCHTGGKVFVIFAVQDQFHFEGFAQVTGVGGDCAEAFVPLPVSWQAAGLFTRWPDSPFPIIMSRTDGQEIEPATGDLMLRTWHTMYAKSLE